MSISFPKVEDIVENLNADLSHKGFVTFNPRDNEIVRYKKEHNPFDFQVGLEENCEDSEEPEFNHVFLSVNYSLPEWAKECREEEIFPGPDLMYRFFRKSHIQHHSLCSNDDKRKGGRINSVYHIGFEKDKITPVEMRVVLREAIDYFCNYITINVEMLIDTQYLAE